MTRRPMPAAPLAGQHPEWCDCNDCYWESVLAAHIALYGEDDPQLSSEEVHDEADQHLRGQAERFWEDYG